MAYGSHTVTPQMDNGKLPPQLYGDGLGCGLSLMKVPDIGIHNADRRRRTRLALSLTVYLTRPGRSQPLSAKTKNISSEGFYCVVEEPFVLGESVHCTIIVPTFDPRVPDKMMGLDCQTEVVRIEFVGTAMYGVAFHISCPWRLISAASSPMSSAAS